MKRLFRHEFFKLFNSLTLKVVMAVVAVLALINSATILFLNNLEGGADALELSGLGLGYVSTLNSFSFVDYSIFFSVMITLIVCHELKSKTMKNTVLSDFTRGEIYFSKFIAMLVSITILITINAVIYIASTVLICGWGKAVTFASVWGDGISIFLMGLLLSYAIAAMLNFFAYLTQNSVLLFVIAIVVPLILTVISLFSFGGGFFEFINRFSYTNVLTNYFNSKTLTNFAYYAVTVILMIVPFTLGGYFVFRKQEIK